VLPGAAFTGAHGTRRNMMSPLCLTYAISNLLTYPADKSTIAEFGAGLPGAEPPRPALWLCRTRWNMTEPGTGRVEPDY
jgi:hypothetical protein